MTAEDRAEDILRRCWWDRGKHPGEAVPEFRGLDVEIAAAIQVAVAEERERCARIAESGACENPASLIRAGDTPAASPPAG